MRFSNIAIPVVLSAAAFPAVVAKERGSIRGLGIFDSASPGRAKKKTRKGPASHGKHPVKPLDRVPTRNVPKVDRARVDKEDAEREARGEPMRFAIPNAMDVRPGRDGDWETLEDGTMVWRYHVQTARGCQSLNFGFGEYNMPEGGSLHIYDPKNKGAKLRPFDSDDNGLGELWTPILPSCDVVIEVNLEAGTNPDDLGLALTSTQVAYRGFGKGRGRGKRGDGGRELSGGCNVDVVCTESDGNQYADIDDWRSEIPSVAVYSTGGSLACTGALVNNVKGDGRPFFLTANHCGVRNGNAASVVTYWNYETSTCQGNPNGTLNLSVSGSTVRVNYGNSDVTLLELSSSPDPAWGITYAGWDATGAEASTAVAIHHPSTDEKRISFEYQTTSTSSYGGGPGSGSTHVRVDDWDMGTTEPGSSGSPLFNQDHRIIGQLHGGGAACGNNQPDWYGKFSVSWANGLSDWLDPDNTGTTSVDTLGGATPAPTVSTAPTPFTSAPTPVCAPLRVEVQTDEYPEETSWSVVDECNSGADVPGMSVATGEYTNTQLYTKQECVPPSRYTFTIVDEWGDGICCGYGSGSYAVTYNGGSVASGGEFGASESASFGSCGVTPAPTPGPTPLIATEFKYLCSNNDFRSDERICDRGNPLGFNGKCPSEDMQGERCAGRGRVCWIAECIGNVPA